MHAAGRMSWQVDVDQSEQLVIGLFVRDVAALHSELAWLPPVSPTVTGNGPQEPEEAGSQWDAWWTQASDQKDAWNGQNQPVFAVSWWTPPAFDALADTPALQAVVAKHFTAAVAWAQARKQEHIDTVLRPGRPPVERRSSPTWNAPPDAGPARSASESPRSQSPGSTSGSCIQTTS